MARTALLEVDFQHWIVALAHDPGVVDRARQARDRWHAAGAHVYCLRYLNPAPGPHHDPEAHDSQFVKAMRPGPEDLVLSKPTSDAFDNPDLHTNLALRGTTHLILTGLVTEHGIAQTALSAHRLGYHVTILRDATASTSQETHHGALHGLQRRGITLR